MAAVVLSASVAFLLAGVGWLALPSRFRLAEDQQQNEILNFFVFVGISFVAAFPVVFFVVGA